MPWSHPFIIEWGAGGIDEKALVKEWTGVRHLIRKYRRSDNSRHQEPAVDEVIVIQDQDACASGSKQGALIKFTRDMHLTYEEEYPIFTKLSGIALTIPMSSVECERAFSLQNRIKNKFQSRLGEKSLENLMIVANRKIFYHLNIYYRLQPNLVQTKSKFQ